MASPTLRSVSVRATGVARTASKSASEPGSVAASLHVALSARMARTASHSRGAATARKSRIRTICACGIAAIDAVVDVEQFRPDRGRTDDARVQHAFDAVVLDVNVAAVSFAGISGRGYDVPTIV